jgi:hypothetical protein
MNTEATGPMVFPFSGSDETANYLPYGVYLMDYNTEIEAALENLKKRKLNPPAVDASPLPLPTLAPRLKLTSRELHEGSGFAVTFGLDTENYSDEDIMAIFPGIGSHIGSQRGKCLTLSLLRLMGSWKLMIVPGAQNKSGLMISHVTGAKEFQDVRVQEAPGTTIISTNRLLTLLQIPAEEIHGSHTSSALPFVSIEPSRFTLHQLPYFET